MLEHSYCHIPGIGVRSEQSLWNSGITDWQHLAGHPALPAKKSDIMIEHIDESRRRLTERDTRYFADRLPAKEHWRLFSHFRQRIAYLDIETTGLEYNYNHITTIALYDGNQIYHYVHGINLDNFAQDIMKYDLMVTFNGKCFDIPFIRTTLGVSLSTPQIDLRFLFADLGIRGGLKSIERGFGIDRGELAEVDGYFAIVLWNDYIKNKNPAALQTLLAYNIADTVNMEELLVRAYNLKVAQTPFNELLQLPIPSAPENPFEVDQATVNRLQTSLYRNC